MGSNFILRICIHTCFAEDFSGRRRRRRKDNYGEDDDDGEEGGGGAMKAAEADEGLVVRSIHEIVFKQGPNETEHTRNEIILLSCAQNRDRDEIQK